jgi:hypothetical protein
MMGAGVAPPQLASVMHSRILTRRGYGNARAPALFSDNGAVKWFVGTGLVLIASGCQVLFPLEDTPDPPATPTVSGRIVEHSVENGPDGIPVAALDQPITAGATVFFEDRSSQPVTIEADGTFVFDRSTQNYRLELIRGPDILEVQEDAATLVVPFQRLGRLDATPTGGGLPLVFPASEPAFNVLATTGQYTASIIDPTTNTLDWSRVAPLGGNASPPIGLLDSAAHDRAWYLRYQGNALEPGQLAISQFAELLPLAFVSQKAEDFTGLTLSPTNILPDLPCVRVQGSVGETLNLMKQALQATPGWIDAARDTPSAVWGVKSAPSTALGHLGALALVSGGLPSLEFSVDARFYNPFSGHDFVATVSLTATRSVAHPDSQTATPLSLTAGLELIDRASATPDCAANQIVLFDVPTIADRIQLDGQPLDTDGKKVPIRRPGQAVVTWEDLGGRVDHYEAALFEVVVDATNRTALEVRRRYRTRERTLEIDSNLLVFGNHYIVAVVASVGNPEVATGDYSTRLFPIGQAVIPSAVFTAM